jgi:peptidoglycan hydrolase-like protein with peptidoglycan-binding domain
MKKLILTIFACLLFSTFISAQGTNNSNPTDSKPTITDKKKRVIFRANKDQITLVQTMLKDKGKYSGEADGKFNSDFRNAIKAFQGDNGLKKTGTLNRATLEKMGIELTDKQKETPVNPNSFAGADDDKEKKPRRQAFRPTKTQITEAQTKLKSAGLYQGEADGKYSKGLRTAIRDYQTDNGLKRKGSLNRATLEKMGIELTEKQSEIPVNPNDIAKPKDPNAKTGKRRVFRANKDQISRVQAMLKEKGLYEGEETGKLNPATRTAIRQWQSGNNVKQTGTLNKETLEAMKIELTDTQKEF